MTEGIDRRRFLEMAMCGAVAACGGGGGDSSDPAPPPDSQIDNAIAELDKLADDLMKKTGVPGMAVAVVRGDQKVYAKGFGNRVVGFDTPVNADTVFQLATVSKSVGATLVAREVGSGQVRWDTRVRSILPWFALKDARASDEVTIGDMYAHRAGLPEHPGDRLEDMGYDRRQVLERLRYLPLAPFRESHNYGNFGLTAGAEATATAVGVDWATLSDIALYQPLDMTRTSSRYNDYLERTNHARGHVRENGTWFLSAQRRNADVQSPAGGASSSVNDMAKWLTMLLGNGVYQGRRIVDAAALEAATSPQSLIAPADGERPARFNGYGFLVGDTFNGRPSYSHSGGFNLGAATHFKVVPSTGVGIVALTNGYPIGVPETLAAQFFDIVETGAIQRDWYSLFWPSFEAILAPEGSLVGVPPPAHPAPPTRPLAGYVGSYANTYHGPATLELFQGALLLKVGPAPVRVPLAHWDGDVFVFPMVNENAMPGTISKAIFAGERLTLEYYDKEQLGTFIR